VTGDAREPASVADAHRAVSRVVREEAGLLTGALVRILGDFESAEEIVGDALLIALERWPVDGLPGRPAAWLMTTARRLALNRAARHERYRAKLAEWRPEDQPEADDRLRLIFTCCHPALSRETQVALTLRTVCGLTTVEIARAFVASESAVARRIVRGRRKIVDAAIPYIVPEEDRLAERLNEVLAVLYLMFNEGSLAATGGPSRRDLAEDSAWLAELLVRLLPREPEAKGLLALMKLHLARAESRFDARGDIVLLKDQDRSRWDRSLIEEGIRWIEEAAAARRPGPYQIEAAIAAVHGEAPTFEATDWRQILALYDLLVALDSSPVVRLNRAIALRQVEGPEPALVEIDRLSRELDGYHVFHAARGELLVELGQIEQARAARLRALELTQNTAERSLMRGRLFGGDG
jgi:predicted RNA polymerase sigma factor